MFTLFKGKQDKAIEVVLKREGAIACQLIMDTTARKITVKSADAEVKVIWKSTSY